MRNSSQYFLSAIDACSARALFVVRLIGAQPRDAGKQQHHLFRFAMIMLLLVLNACTNTPPEQALRKTIDEMQQAGAQKDIQGLMNSFADDFAGSEGMSRDEFRRYVSLIWLRHNDIGIQMGPMQVELLDDRATVNFTVALSGGQGLMPDQGQIYQVQTGWRLDGDKWKLISATWKPAL
jgi:hypothetical protein